MVIHILDDTSQAGRPGSPDTPRVEHALLASRPGYAVLRTGRQDPGRRGAPTLFGVDLGAVLRIARVIDRSTAFLALHEDGGYHALLARMLRGARTPVSIIFHGHGWRLRRNRLMARLARSMRNVEFLCLSEALAAQVRDGYGVDPARVHVVPYGADAAFFQPVPPTGDGMIVSAGAATRDYQTLADAVRDLPVAVRIAADSAWRNEPLNIKGGLPENVTVASGGDYRGLRDIYAEALFVAVPLNDAQYACGYAVIAEAMAMGKAVIATRTQAPSDLVEDGVTGIYVAPHDVASWREAIDRLLRDPEQARRMGAAGRAAAEQHFNLDHYADRVDAQTRANAAGAARGA